MCTDTRVSTAAYDHLQNKCTVTIFVALISITVECYEETPTGHKGGLRSFKLSRMCTDRGLIWESQD